MKNYRVRVQSHSQGVLVGVEQGRNIAEVRTRLRADTRVKEILAIVPESKWAEDDAKNAPPARVGPSLKTLRYVDVFDVFEGLDIDMGWFLESDMMFGDANYSLVTVKRVRDMLNEYAVDGDTNNEPLAAAMLDRLAGFSEETLINLEK